MMTILTLPAFSRNSRTRVSLALLAVFLVAVTVVLVAALARGFQTGEWQIFALAGNAVFLGSVMAVSLWWVLHGNDRQAGFTAIIAIDLAAIALVLLISGLGTLISLSIVFMGLLFAIQILPAKDTVRGVAAALVGSFLATLADFFFPAFQLDSPAIQTLYVYVVAGIVISFTAFLLTQFRNYAIPSKLLSSYLIAALIPIGALTYIMTQSSQQALTQSANSALLGTAKQVADDLDVFIQTELDSVNSHAQLPHLARYLTLAPEQRATAEMIATLKSFASRDVNIDSIGLLDANGIDVVDTNPAEINTNKSDRDYFQAVLRAGKPYASPAEFSQATGKYALFFAAPVRDEQGKMLGVLRLRSDAAILQKHTADNNDLAGPQSFGILLDENNVRLAHGTQPSLIFKSVMPLEAKTLANLIAAKRLPDLPADQLSTNLPEFQNKLTAADNNPVFDTKLVAVIGDQAIAAVARLKTQPWQIVFIQPSKIIYAPVVTQTQIASIASLVMASLASVLAFVITRQFSRPIENLTQTAQQITAGDLAATATVHSNDEVGELARTFNTMTSQLRQSLENVQRRGQALELSSQVSRRLSTILDQSELVNQVVEQVQAAFNYYHVHIYLFDEAKENLVMVGGTGDAGSALLARGHKITSGKGLVGHAAEANAPVIVSNTSADPDWLPNPLLPDTKSEIAAPIALGDTVLGVLDVQQNIANGLTRDDAQLLVGLANQIAIALQNARSYAETQTRAQQEQIIRELGESIRSSADVDVIMRRAVQGIGRTLGRRVFIQVGTKS